MIFYFGADYSFFGIGVGGEGEELVVQSMTHSSHLQKPTEVEVGGHMESDVRGGKK